MMTLQVLVSTMHQSDHSLLEKMNIESDAIVVNQCDKNEIEEFDYKGHQIKWISLNERGVGLSRNTALMSATADIVLFADDDVVYENDYVKTVLNEFEKNPKAGLITFNLTSLNPKRPEKIVNSSYKLNWHNCLKFGAFRIAIRREKVLMKNQYFSLFFGGGAKYSAGEDNMFITELLRKKICGIASNTIIGTVKQEESTWFKGYDHKYYFDRGCLMRAIYGKRAKLITLLLELKSIRKNHKISFWNRIHYEFDGIKQYDKI